MTIGVTLAVGAIGLVLFLILRQGPTPQRKGHTLVARDQPGWILQLFFSPDSKRLISTRVSSGKESILSIWDVATKEQVHSFKLPHRAHFISLSANWDLLAVTCGGPVDDIAKRQKDDGKPREVRLYSFPDMKDLGTIESDRFIPSAVLSPDGKLLAAIHKPDTTARCEVILWDVGTRKPKHVFPEGFYQHGLKGATVRFSPDGKKVAYTDSKRDQRVILEYEVESGKLLNTICQLPNDPERIHIDAFDYFPDGKQILLKSYWSLRTYDFATAQYQSIVRVESREGTIQESILSSDGRWLLFGIDDQARGGAPPRDPSVVIWDVQANKAHDRWNVSGIGRFIGAFTLSADKKYVAVRGNGLQLFPVAAK
jgi:WD40 repeat protein